VVHFQTRRRGGMGAGIIVCLFLLGCSPSGDMQTAPVKGKVTYNGQPLPSGTVMFVPTQGPAATGEIRPDGSYSLGTYGTSDGAVLGKHKVTITALADMGELLPEAQDPTPPPLVPDKYLSHETSGLEVEVKSGTNEHDFVLTDD
jgi:hypothetical protein